MKITVRAKPNSREEKVERIDDNTYSVFVREPPVSGRANAAIIRVLSEFFHTRNVRIAAGHASRNKIVEIL